MKPFQIWSSILLFGQRACSKGSNRSIIVCKQNVRGLSNWRLRTIAPDFPVRTKSIPFSTPCVILNSACREMADRFISTSNIRLKEALSSAELKKAMEELTDQFMEARELIDDARESMETVYFSEDMAEAQEAVRATLDQYQKLLDRLSEDQRQEVLRTIGLRMEELKAQEQAIKDQLH